MYVTCVQVLGCSPCHCLESWVLGTVLMIRKTQNIPKSFIHKLRASRSPDLSPELLEKLSIDRHERAWLLTAQSGGTNEQQKTKPDRGHISRRFPGWGRGRWLGGSLRHLTDTGAVVYARVDERQETAVGGQLLLFTSTHTNPAS